MTEKPLDLDRFFEISLDLFSIAGPEGHFLWLSESWTHVLGWPTHDLKTKPFIEFLHPDDVASTIQAYDRVIAGDPIVRFDNRYLTADGRYVWLQWNAVPQPDGTIYSMTRDITERKQIERDLADKNSRLTLAMRATRDGMWDWNPVTGTIWFSPRFKEQLGYRDDELPNVLETWEAVIIPEDREPMRRMLDDFSAGRTNRFETVIRFRHKDGHIVSSASRAVSQRNADSTVTRMIGAHTDITEQKQYEAQILERQRLLLLAEQLAQVGYWHVNLVDGTITWSDEVYRIYGWDPETTELTLEKCVAAYHPDDQPTVDAEIKRAIETKTGFDFKLRLVRPDKEIRYVTARGLCEFDDTGTVNAIFGVFQDITVQTLTEMNLVDARRRADAANETKSRFLATMSHELRTPMAGIKGMVELLRQSRLGDEEEHYLETLDRSADALHHLLDDLLDFSKFEAGRLALAPSRVALGELLEDVRQLLSAQASRKGVRFSMLPDRDLPGEVWADSGRLRQILLNIGGNAVKFTDEGTIELAVSQTAVGSEKRQLHFRVADTGIGMNEATLGQLFEPFVQASPMTGTQRGGTGLGLVISKYLIEAMDGTITVDSTLGEGTTFLWDVTVDNAHDRQVVVAPSEEPDRASRSLNLLIAEDNDVNRMLVSRMMERAGHSVIAVVNGAEAVEALKQQPFDAVLMDMQMPVMDGAEATRTIRALGNGQSRTPVLALTADAIPAHIDRYREQGVDMVLTKPIDWRELDRALAKVTAPASTTANPPATPAPDGLAGTGSRHSGYRLGTAPYCDPDAQRALEAVIGGPALAAMANQLIEQAIIDIADMRAALATNDLPRVCEIAHSLAGASGNLGFPPLSNAARDIQLTHGTGSDVSSLIDALEAVLADTRGQTKDQSSARPAPALDDG